MQDVILGGLTDAEGQPIMGPDGKAVASTSPDFTSIHPAPDGSLWAVAQFESPQPAAVYLIGLDQDKASSEIGSGRAVRNRERQEGAGCLAACTACGQQPESSRASMHSMPAPAPCTSGVSANPAPPRPALQASGKLTPKSLSPVSFSKWGGVWNLCAGSVSPWNTHLGGAWAAREPAGVRAGEEDVYELMLLGQQKAAGTALRCTALQGNRLPTHNALTV